MTNNTLPASMLRTVEFRVPFGRNSATSERKLMSFNSFHKISGSGYENQSFLADVMFSEKLMGFIS